MYIAERLNNAVSFSNAECAFMDELLIVIHSWKAQHSHETSPASGRTAALGRREQKCDDKRPKLASVR